MSFSTYKRWTLRDGAEETDLIDLVRGQIVPQYRKLDPRVELKLLKVRETRSFLAIQVWPDREYWRSATVSKHFELWFEGYRPVLERWDQLVSFDEEWETEDVV